jgi:N-acetylglucosamine kinase-like BadF-type ATPase
LTAGRAAVLAIDGGNSKTDVALVAADGTLLGSGRGPGSRVFPTPETIAAIGAVIAAAAQSAGLPPGWPAADAVVACMANADLPEEEELLAGLLAAAGWGASTTVANDTFAVLRAGLAQPAGRPWGVAVTCGAGINCVGVAPDGRTTGFLALGGITGDWGGGLGLGHAALWWAIRAEDGRGPETALRAAVAGHFGQPSVRDVAIAIHQGRIPYDDLQGLAPVLLAAAGQGDQAALRLVSKLADEIVAMASTVVRRLDLAGAAVPVVLGGGLLTARDPRLTAWITERLAAQAPLARVTVTDVPPIAGAALLGLDRAGAGPAAEQRLRAAYPPPTPRSVREPARPDRLPVGRPGIRQRPEVAELVGVEHCADHLDLPVQDV